MIGLKLWKTAGKVFLVMFCLSFVAFLVTFAVGLPLVFEHRLISSRLSLGYLLNFLSGMILFFLFVGALSVLVCLFMRGMSGKVKIFVIILLTECWGFFGGLITVSLYYGNRSDPLWIIGLLDRLLNPFWILSVLLGNGGSKNEFGFLLGTALLLFFFTVLAAVSAILYRVYSVARKKR